MKKRVKMSWKREMKTSMRTMEKKRKMKMSTIQRVTTQMMMICQTLTLVRNSQMRAYPGMNWIDKPRKKIEKLLPDVRVRMFQ